MLITEINTLLSYGENTTYGFGGGVKKKKMQLQHESFGMCKILKPRAKLS